LVDGNDQFEGGADGAGGGQLDVGLGEAEQEEGASWPARAGGEEVRGRGGDAGAVDGDDKAAGFRVFWGCCG